MQFQENKDYYYKGILNHLTEQIPEFHSISPFLEDDVYIVLGEFGDFLIKHLNNEEVFNKGVNFINDSLKKGKYETQDVIVSQVFQNFYESTSSIQKIRGSLNHKALEIFDKYFNDYNKIA